MTENFDEIVIGGGVAGLTVANLLAAAGHRVAIVEERDWGGTTITRGSTPKKALLAVAEAHHQLRLFQQNGFDTVPAINWNQAGIVRDHLIMAESNRAKTRLLQNGVLTIEGHAEFLSPNVISVNGTSYLAQKFVLATGARPRACAFPGHELVGHSASLLRAQVLPAKITILGAGIIAFALAGIASEAGAQVTIVQRNQVALRSFDREFVGQLIAHLKRQNVQFLFDEQVTRVERDQEQLVVTLATQKKLVTDAVYNVAGRVPNFEALKLERAGVQTSVKGIRVDAQLRTTAPNVWAIGDCTDTAVPKLSSYASYQAKYVAGELLKPSGFAIEYPTPAMTVFSIPKLGQTGVTTQQAADRPNEFMVRRIDASNWQNYAKNRDTSAEIKLVSRRSDGRIVGATVISDQADILINDLTLLLNNDVTNEQLQHTILAYPSLADDLYGMWQ